MKVLLLFILQGFSVHAAWEQFASLWYFAENILDWKDDNNKISMRLPLLALSLSLSLSFLEYFLSDQAEFIIWESASACVCVTRIRGEIFLSFIFSGSVGWTTAAIIQPAAFPPPPPRLLFIFIQRAQAHLMKNCALCYIFPQLIKPRLYISFLW